MFERYKSALNFVWNVCSKPDATLRYEALLNLFYGKNILRQYIMPLAEILMLMAFIGALFWDEMHLASAVVKSIFEYFCFIVSYGVLFWLIRWCTIRFFAEQIEDRNISLLVASLMAVTFAINLLLSLMPNMFFINFFYGYIFYLVWVMSEGVVDIAEELRNKYMFVVSICVIIIPLVVMMLLKNLAPNL